MAWIHHPTSLKGNTVELVPLEPKHFNDLISLAKNKKIWQHYIFDGSDTEKLLNALVVAVHERITGAQYPFVIVYKPENKIIGSTRLMDIIPEHKKLEIGFTWLHPDYWGNIVNAECKLLLLTYCFETLQTCRVMLRTDEHNIRSRKAIEKIGGRFEGILKHDLLRENGTHRDSAYYSITDNEWETLKPKLTTLAYEQRTPLPTNQHLEG